MNKADLIEKVSEKSGYSKAETKKVLDTFLGVYYRRTIKKAIMYALLVLVLFM
jgi:nucleoid DNA-binding protein